MASTVAESELNLESTPEPEPSAQPEPEPVYDSQHSHRDSHTISQQTQALIKQYQNTINELQRELGSAREENEKLMVKNETLHIEYDSKMDELNLEIDEMQIESQQYQIRYQEINEELHELRGSQADFQSSGKENKELLIRLQNKEQNEMSLIIDLEQGNKQILTLKNQIKNIHSNTSKLQKAMLIIKKDKSQIEKNLQSAMDKYDILQSQSGLEIQSLTDRLSQLQRENEIYRQSLSNAEQEKMTMQQEFTDATMELLHDELNDADDIKQDINPSLRLERISTSDMKRTYDTNAGPGTPEPSTPKFGSSTFIKQRFGSQTSLPDQSLLDTFAENDVSDPYGHSRNQSVDSRMGGYDGGVDPVKLKQDIRDILVQDIKVLLNQEVTNMSTTNLPGINGNGNASHLDQKMDQLLDIANNTKSNLDKKDQETKLDQETLNKIMNDFEKTMKEILNKDVIENIMAQKNDRKQFENTMNERMNKLLENINDDNLNDKMGDILQETIQSQMTVLQIALENQIGNTVSESVDHVINKNMNNDKLRDNIKNDMNEELNEIKQLIINDDNNNNNNNNNNDNKLEIEELINNKLEDCINNIMNGKIDGFMDDFRKEVVPEVQAVFEQLSLNKNNNNNRRNNYDENESVDDEKEEINSNRRQNELLLITEKLKAEIEDLKREKFEYDATLRDAATSKVHQVVKLQNLVDHMRNDNRILQFQLNKYKETFIRIKENNQQSNVVNKLWGYFAQNNNNTSNHLST